MEAIAAYQQAIRLNREDGNAHFRLVVSYRRRHDSDLRQSDDFQTAVNHWGHALDLDPNQYIWRRRIQQFGPRLAKPYPFYDWVSTARREISARGETPSVLVTEPGGAEIASPQKVFEAGTNGKPNPTRAAESTATSEASFMRRRLWCPPPLSRENPSASM